MIDLFPMALSQRYNPALFQDPVCVIILSFLGDTCLVLDYPDAVPSSVSIFIARVNATCPVDDFLDLSTILLQRVFPCSCRPY